MQIIKSPSEMRSISKQLRSLGKKIAFVPTMGALHEGHLSLLHEGRKARDILVLSIYVNPTQFAPNEDLSKYPRSIETDLDKAASSGVDIVFLPSDEMMYPKGYQTYVEVTDITKNLCGASRPSHFKGVTTIVQKLFNIVQPDVALFGEKDYQQLITIKTMARDLNIPVEIIGMPIVRESDGLAMSSRNIYLSKEERAAALSLPRALSIAQEMVKSGKENVWEITAAVRKIIESTDLVKVDYIKIYDPYLLKELQTVKSLARLLIAAFVDKTRLIDNCELIKTQS